jgi:hypothetical protein
MKITKAINEEYRVKVLNAGITVDKVRSMVKAKNISYVNISKAININASTICNILKDHRSNEKTLYLVHQYVDSVVYHGWVKNILPKDLHIESLVHEQGFSYSEAIQILA